MDKSHWYVSLEGQLVCSKPGPVGIRILHLEDHSIFHDGMRKCIDEYLPEPSYAYFHSGQAALDHYKDIFITEEKPDLIITDINHPDLGGIEFVRAIRELENGTGIHTPIMVLSMVEPENYIELVNEQLIECCLSKNTSVEELLKGIIKLLP